MEGKLVGRVFNYLDRVGVVGIELSNEVKLGDTLRFVSEVVDFTEVVGSMQIDGKNVEKAGKGQRIGIKVGERVNKGAKVYLN